MVTDPQILNALKEKEREYTFYPDAAELRRTTFYLWDAADSKADEFCYKIGKLEFGEPTAVRLTEEQELEEWIRRYIVQMKNSQNPCHHKVYCLLVSSDPLRFNGRVFRNVENEFVELIYQLIYLGDGAPEEAGNNNIDINWIVRSDDVLAARVLLADAAYSYELILPATWKFVKRDGWYKLRAKRYSSVADDICGQMYHRLNTTLINESADSLNNRMGELFGKMKHRIAEVYNHCPHVRYLPLMYRMNNSGRLWNARYPHRMNNEEAVSILFGLEHGELRPEWLRKAVTVSYLPEECAENIRRYENEIQDLLYQLFTLSDLYGRTAAIAQKYASDRIRECGYINEEIGRYLKKEFTAKTGTPQEIWDGLSRYFELWNRYISEYLIGIWWKKIAGFIIQLSNSKSTDFRRIRQAYDEFKGYVDDRDEEIDKDIWQYATPIRSFSDLILAIQSSSAVTNFTSEMLKPLMRRASRLYQETGDDLPIEKRPKIGLILSDRLTSDSTPEIIGFEWRCHPRSYVPESIIFELRMYEDSYVQ